MLNISQRQQAMLKEMGVELPWQLPARLPASTEQKQTLEKQTSVPVPETKEPVAPVHATHSNQATQVHQAKQPQAANTATAPTVPLAASQTTIQPEEITLAATSERTQQITQMSWQELEAAVSACTSCQLCKSRKQTVFGVGHTQARIMIVGEAPGEQEDKQGQPFVGQAGKLLDRMLQPLSLARTAQRPENAIYIANVLKCRPPRNRNPELSEMALCEPFLKRQIELIGPKIIIAMGRFAVQTLLNTHEAIGRLRGKVHHYGTTPVIVTYHPAYLLRNPVDKRKSWADLCLMAETLSNL